MNSDSLPQGTTDTTWRRLGLLLGFVGLLPPVVAYSVSGRSLLEKTLTTMVQPWFLTLVSVLVCGVICSCKGLRWTGRFLMFLGSVAWVLSTPLVGSKLISWWENQIASTTLDASAPLDTLVVLGGGTSTTPSGEPQLGGSGDRVMLAARLYHQGYVKQLVTTGEKLAVSGTFAGSNESQIDPSTGTHKIWTDLGIPEDAISKLRGENTSQEMRLLRGNELLWRDKRCGLLTSAFHMPRAMRLAKREGLELIPVAADYQGTQGPITMVSLMPEIRVLAGLQTIFKEVLAIAIQR